jgi:acetyl esterase
MPEYEVIHKPIGLTEYEYAIQRQNEGNTGFITRLPLPVLAAVVKAGIGKMREKGMEYELPETKTKNAILKSELSVDAGAGKTSVYFYRREGAEGNYPLFFFIHGGGFLGGTHLANESLMKRLCDEHDIVCASVEYHFAPEIKFPTAVRECEAGLVKLLETPEISQYIDRERVFISGDSAGGNLAAVLCLLMKNERSFHPAGQILLYPVTNMHTCDTESYRRKEPEFAAMRKGMLLSRRLYARSKNDYKDIYFSPYFTTEKDDPKPTKALLLLAGRDGLLDDGVLYGKHLSELGGEARTVIYDEAFHAFANGLGDSEVAEDMYREIVSFLGLGQ